MAKNKLVTSVSTARSKQRGKKRSNFFRKNYEHSWNYLKESKKFIFVIVGLFFLFALVGFLFPAPQAVIEQIMKFIEELVAKTQGMNQWQLIGFIFWNNLQSSFFGLVFGLLFGIFPIMAAVANGYLLGYVGKIVVSEESFLSLWRILPHGIFELPAVFISLGLGLRLGGFIFSENKKQAFSYYFFNGLRVFFFVVLPLLVVAAIIEGNLIFWFG